MTTSASSKLRIEPIWIIAFTGHRPKSHEKGRSPEDIAACESSLRSTLEKLQKIADEHSGKCELMCSVADGADLLAVAVAESIDMPVHLILPMAPSAFKSDFVNSDGSLSDTWNRVESYVAKAMDCGSDWTFRVALGDNMRPACYHDANLQMLEIADVLVAIHNGCESDSLGGTTEVIRVADHNHLNVPTVVLDSTQGGKVVRHDNWSPNSNSENALSEVNSILADHESIQVKGGRESDLPVWKVFQTLDEAANQKSFIFRGSLKLSIWLHFGATILATISAAFAKVFAKHLEDVPKVLTGLELVLVVLAFGLIWRLTRNHAGKFWRQSRLAAEVTDSLVHSSGLVDPLHPLIARHKEDWKRFAISLALVSHRQRCEQLKSSETKEPIVPLLENYVVRRVGGQLKYLRIQSASAAKRLAVWKLIAQVSSLIAIPVILAAFVMKIGFDGMGKGGGLSAFFVLALPIFLPLLAGLAASLIVVDDSARRSTRYKQVIERLERYSVLLKTIRTASAAERVVLEVEDILLDEIIEWNATAKNLGH